VIEDAFGSEVDYAQLHKVYRAPLENETRYSPAKCIGGDMKDVSGNPDFKHVSTSFVERQNWTVRTNMRRYTPVEWVFAEAREPRGSGRAELFRLQFHQNSSYTAHESSDGCWHYGSTVEHKGSLGWVVAQPEFPGFVNATNTLMISKTVITMTKSRSNDRWPDQASKAKLVAKQAPMPTLVGVFIIAPASCKARAPLVAA
jgi:hypothetical protein